LAGLALLVASTFLSFFLANFISVLAGAAGAVAVVAAGATGAVVLAGSVAKAAVATKVAIRVAIVFILSFL
jgi:glutamate/tyrosine decarboxylase-like PLP-dependent enzyme